VLFIEHNSAGMGYFKLQKDSARTICLLKFSMLSGTSSDV
jgi:hypothetical protein